MPFTLSHAVLAPPLAKLSRNKLPVAALAIGCMTPDLVRLFTDENVTISHEWSGLIVPNLIIGMLFCLLWYGLFRPTFYYCLRLEDDLNLSHFNQYCGFLIACIMAILVGSATHIIWDGLTHDDFRSFAFQEFLSQNMTFLNRSYPVHRFLQLATSLLSLPILAWMCYRYIRQHRIAQPVSGRVSVFFGIMLFISLFSGSIFLLHFSNSLDPQLWHTNTYAITGKAINYFFRGFLISLSLWCLGFVILQRCAIGDFKKLD